VGMGMGMGGRRGDEVGRMRESERDECCIRQDPVESELSSGLESDERKEANMGIVLLASGFGPGLVHGEGRWAVSQAGFEK
jgi:hypothetical protein